MWNLRIIITKWKSPIQLIIDHSSTVKMATNKTDKSYIICTLTSMSIHSYYLSNFILLFIRFVYSLFFFFSSRTSFLLRSPIGFSLAYWMRQNFPSSRLVMKSELPAHQGIIFYLRESNCNIEIWEMRTTTHWAIYFTILSIKYISFFLKCFIKCGANKIEIIQILLL